MSFRDITQQLARSTPTWPGDTGFSSVPTWLYGHDCPVNVSQSTMSTHGGTHADAPLHYDPAGLPIDSVPLDPYIGRARLFDLRGCGPVIEPDLLLQSLDDVPPRVLLRTYDMFPHSEWLHNFTTVAPETIVMLAGHGVTLIGIDSPSLDPQDSKVMAAHAAVRDCNMRILEGLVLDGCRRAIMN